MSTVIGSVVIPAHNEAHVLPRILNSLQAAANDGRLEVCVISNGSTDGTVGVATDMLKSAPLSQVLTMHQASKIEALRLGNRSCLTFPRLYVDADISCESETIELLLRTLASSPFPCVASPKVRIDRDMSSWPVRAYYRVWLEMPYLVEGQIGSGIVGMNEDAFRRLGELPDILNDDGYIMRSFSPEERITVAGYFKVYAPLTAFALIRRRSRIHLGNKGLASVGLRGPRKASLWSLVRLVRRQRFSYAELMAFLSITVAARLLAVLRVARGKGDTWSQDNTSRLATT